MSETITDTQTYKPFIESNPSASATELREAMNEYGYLFFRALVPTEDVLAVRRDVVALLVEAGWIDTSHDPMQAIVSPTATPTTEGKPDYLAVYRKILRTPSFHNFPCHPALMEVARNLLNNDEVLVHPRRIGRITFPQSIAWTTPPHQDYHYIRGSVETFSCWTPLGACSQQLGCLAIWSGSHRFGFIEHTVQHPGAVGGRGVPVDEARAEWHSSDFGIGDALFFRSYTVHKALPNLTKDYLRISTDNRYQLSKDDIEPGALRPHFNLNLED